MGVEGGRCEGGWAAVCRGTAGIGGEVGDAAAGAMRAQGPTSGCTREEDDCICRKVCGDRTRGGMLVCKAPPVGALHVVQDDTRRSTVQNKLFAGMQDEVCAGMIRVLHAGVSLLAAGIHNAMTAHLHLLRIHSGGCQAARRMSESMQGLAFGQAMEVALVAW